jgi:hypothetical protein
VILTGYKEYVIDFKIGDGTTHSVPLNVPIGENGGYYTPKIEQISNSEIKISYTPSMSDMPAVEPVTVELTAGQGSGGNVDFTTDETLTLKNGVLSVNTTNDMEQDNTLPITSAGVFATVGNIEALLKTI